MFNFKNYYHYVTKSTPIIYKIFMESLVIMIVAELSIAISNLLDGLMTSVFLGADALAAQNMAYPFFGMIGIPSGMIATGLQLTVTQCIGRGDFKKQTNYFPLHSQHH